MGSFKDQVDLTDWNNLTGSTDQPNLRVLPIMWLHYCYMVLYKSLCSSFGPAWPILINLLDLTEVGIILDPLELGGRKCSLPWTARKLSILPWTKLIESGILSAQFWPFHRNLHMNVAGISWYPRILSINFKSSLMEIFVLKLQRSRGHEVFFFEK